MANPMGSFPAVGVTAEQEEGLLTLLRSRIEADPSTPVLITTVRGVGYRFAAA